MERKGTRAGRGYGPCSYPPGRRGHLGPNALGEDEGDPLAGDRRRLVPELASLALLHLG
jgi:hypothetical protein